MSSNQFENSKDRQNNLWEMAAVLAHEIKNPMNSIIINLEVLKSALQELCPSATPASDRAKKYLDVIESEIRRLDKTLKGFLDLASNNTPVRQNIQLNSLLQSLSEFVKLGLSARQIEIKLDLHPHLPQFLGNADQIRQAVLNLVINAEQAMPQGGCITLASSYDGQTIRIDVSDTGVGIPESLMSQIFSPHFSTKEKGSGLGLVIVRRILREYGGYVDVKSETGKGSSFSLVLPRNAG